MRIIYAVLCLLALPGVWFAWQQKMWLAISQAEVYFPFLGGLGIYIALIGIKSGHFRHNLKWFQVFSHELTHAIFSFLTLSKIHGFKATANAGGYVSIQGRANMLMILSPYCVPLFTLIGVITAIILDAQQNAYMLGLIGFTYMFHIHTFIDQTRGFQTDLRMYGLLPSYLFILLLHLILSGTIIGSIVEGFFAFQSFGLLAWEYSYRLGIELWEHLR